MTDPTRLIDCYLDGTLSKEALDQLEQDLASNPAYADAFAHAMMIDALLESRFEREAITSTMSLGDGSFLSEQDLQLLQNDYDRAQLALVQLDPASSTSIRPRANSKSESVSFSEAVSALSYGVRLLVRSKPMPFVGALAAALVLLALWLINPFAGPTPPAAPDFALPPIPTAQPVVATLTAEHDAQWAQGAFAPGSPLHANQRLTLTQGFAQITTARGAVAILEAPATIELTDSDNALRLHAGKLVGICETESSKGFLVGTSHIDVIDLGTRFGVAIAPSQGTLVDVFEGEVEVSSQDGSIPARTLKRTESIALNTAGQLVTPQTGGTSPFARLAMYGNGIEQVSESIAVVPSRPEKLGKSQFVSNTHAFVFNELRGVSLPGDVSVSFTEPGRHENFLPVNTGTHLIPAGTVVRSYVIRANSDGSRRSYHGQLTFAAPILGVMAIEEDWMSFNAMMPGKSIEFEQTADSKGLLEGLDSERFSDDVRNADWLKIHPDRATLEFRFVARDYPDHIRVFVAMPDEASIPAF